MKRIAAGLLSASLFLALSQTPAAAQAPPSPQPGQEPKENPPQSQTPQNPPGQQPQTGGVSISVEVPLVTIEVGPRPQTAT